MSVQATSRQLWTVVNFLLTVVGAFVFAFFAAGAAGFTLPTVRVFETLALSVCVLLVAGCLSLSLLLLQCVFAGLFVGILVFIADLYFLVKVPTVVEGSKRPRSRVKRD